MKQIITLLGQPIEYTLVRSKRSRSIRISITPDGLVMTVPAHRNIELGESFIHRKAQWILDKMEYFKKQDIVTTRVSKSDMARLRNEARVLVTRRLEYFNQFYGFTYKKITIRNQKSRWGSCSKEGNINFSYKLAILPPRLSDYIVVHELCHLGELNHSENFWKLVGKTMPDYKSYRKELHKTRIVIE